MCCWITCSMSRVMAANLSRSGAKYGDFGIIGLARGGGTCD